MTPPAAPLAAFSAYGIELEYMIVGRDSLAVLPIADALLDGMKDSGAGSGFAWSNELVLHLLEVKNQPPSPRLDELAQGFHAEIARVGDMLAGLGARLMPGGMHPWMNPATQTRVWPHRDAAIYAAYDRIFDCRAHGWANIQSMQLNLPFANDEEFARLHAAARLLSPILPALAASSPIADARVQVSLDFRLECYRRHTARMPSLLGRVVPENSSSLADYRAAILEPMYAEIAPHDPAGVLRQDWLNTRGVIPRFDRHAIEIRVIDMQECPQADLAIAALVSAVIRALYDRRWSDCAEQQDMATEALAAILDDCIRDADGAIIVDPRYLALLGFPTSRCEARELWRHLFRACHQDPLISRDNKAALEIILDRGTLAHRLLGAVGPDSDPARLAAVYRELCDCLVEGRMFMGRP